MDDYISKPVRLEELAVALGRCSVQNNSMRSNCSGTAEKGNPCV